MINYKDIIESTSPEKSKFIITVDGEPVWDYKASGFTIFLISEDPWEGVEDEFVTVEELRKYIVGNEIPYNQVIFAKESNKQQLNNYKWSENQLLLA